jgi:undecaprenyl-diphosphatase
MTLTPYQAAFLGLVQGLTEFLPVSSSGHLVLAERVIGVETGGLRFEVFVHFATLVAVIIVFWSSIRKVLASLIPVGDPEQRAEKVRGRWLLAFIIMGNIPAALAGLLLENQVATIYQNPRTVGVMLLVTGTLLISVRKGGGGRNRLNGWDCARVGIAQAFALLPGISRSGATISSGMLGGLKSGSALEFSFLLAIPAMLGATVLKAREAFLAPAHAEWGPYLVGMIVAGLSGYLALRLLRRWIAGGKLHWFAPYCWVVGLVVLVLGLD